MKRFQTNRRGFIVQYKYLQSLFIAYLVECTIFSTLIRCAYGQFIALCQLHGDEYFECKFQKNS